MGEKLSARQAAEAALRCAAGLWDEGRQPEPPVAVCGCRQGRDTGPAWGRLSCFPQDAQEALDMCLVGLRLAADARVGLPSTLFVGGGDEPCEVDVPCPEQVQAFLAGAPARPEGRAHATGRAQTAYEAHKAMARALDALDEAEEALERAFGRGYPSAFEEHLCDDADYVAVTLGGAAPAMREAVDRLRGQGMAAGLVRVRYLRPFDGRTLALILARARAVGVVEPTVEPGAEGPVFASLNSALFQHDMRLTTTDFILGENGALTPEQAQGVFKTLAYTASGAASRVQFLGVDSLADALGRR